MSSGPKTRKAIGPTSPRGIYTKSVRAPGVSLDMPDGESEKKLAGGGMPDLTGDGKVTRADVLKGRGVFKKGGMLKASKRRMPKFGPKYGFKKFSEGGSASKRADGCAVKGKTRGKIV